MCGIIGYTGSRDAISVIVEGLRRLEYRGYDSAGVACHSGGKLHVARCKGKIAELEKLLDGHTYSTTTAIGHTRWATHGRPSEVNAHPHRSGKIVLVHNGIIENYHDLKVELQAAGYVFTSETDTEVIAHLVHKHTAPGSPLEDAVRSAMKEARGAFAIAVMSEDEPGKVVALRKDSPLVVGVGDGESFVASDIPAFLMHTREVVFLEDNEMAVLTPGGVSFVTIEGEAIEKPPTTIAWNTAMAEKGGYKHFMLKEIHEQPRAIADTIAGRLHYDKAEINVEEFGLTKEDLRAVKRIHIVACGTSWHAALTGKYMIESLARIPVEVDIASEFRYRDPVFAEGDLFVSITQSGETADTLAAQRLAARSGVKTLNICNVVGSTSAREADAVFFTRSGPEIGVASTKAFTTQITGLFILALGFGRAKGMLDDTTMRTLMDELLALPDKVEHVLGYEPALEKLARDLRHHKAFLYLGRGVNFPIALEGALKLKEISYIHAEGYPAGEMKHGPIALIDEGYPVVFLAQDDGLYEKVVSNMQEIKSRGGRIMLVSEESVADKAGLADKAFTVPRAHSLLVPVLMCVPLQMLAYHIGIALGCDVDQPRNLAKSVTVE